MTSTSSSMRIFRPVVVGTSTRRSASRTPNENAAARVPPPENARTTRSCWSPRLCSSLSNCNAVLSWKRPSGGLTGRVAKPPHNTSVAMTITTAATSFAILFLMKRILLHGGVRAAVSPCREEARDGHGDVVYRILVLAKLAHRVEDALQEDGRGGRRMRLQTRHEPALAELPVTRVAGFGHAIREHDQRILVLQLQRRFLEARVGEQTDRRASCD